MEKNLEFIGEQLKKLTANPKPVQLYGKGGRVSDGNTERNGI